jgi:glucokinase
MAQAGKDPQTLVLALDYGGSKHTAAIAVAGERVWLACERIASPPGADARYDQAAMIGLARRLLAGAEGRLVAVGVSFGGPVDAAAGTVKLSHHVPGWEDTPLREQLQAAFGVPAVVENDANAAALGEWKFGAGQGCASLLYVTVSTGIGGGWVLNGQIYRGADGMAGEIGHVVVRSDGAACVCGKRGCLEAEAGGPAIARLMRQRWGQGSPEPWTGESVAVAAAKGDPRAQEVMDDAARFLGAGLGGAINLMNPERVVLGGGVANSGERWWRIVIQTARFHALPQMRVDIQPAALGDEAPLWGAVALAETVFTRPAISSNPVPRVP